MFEKFLEYQSLDSELVKLERQLLSDPNKQNAVKISSVIKNLQAKLIELDAEAEKATKEFQKLSDEYDKKKDLISSLSSKKDATADEIQDSISKLNALVSQLSNMERILSSKAEQVSNILKNFDYCKNSIVSNKEKYKICKDKSNDTEGVLLPQIEKLKQQLSSMEKNLEPKLLSHYKQLRQSNVWPVFVPLRNNACGGCAMGLSSAILNKVHSSGYIECEQCGRFIYDLG